MSKDHMNMDQSPRAQKAKSLQTLTTGPLSSSLSSLSSSSRAIPADKDFHFFYNFDEFKLPIQEISKNSQTILETIGSSAQIWDKPIPLPEENDVDNAYDWLVNVNDEIFERFDVFIDEFERIRKKEEELGRALGPVADNETGFQLVYGKKKRGASKSGSDSPSGKGELSGVKVAARDKQASGTGKAKVPFHIPTIRRPQDEYNILVNNSNQPFEHVWLQRSEDGQQFIHPLEKHSVLEFVDKDIGDIEPIEPPSMENTPFKLVEEVKDLKALAAKLHNVNEFAVDLEHNQYRSFQGLTCLMQISTRTEDFVVDTLKLRIHVGPYLREVFKDPTKKKVMHGADRDIVWLQRDFGIYLCNLFDTGQASRVMKLERNSLEFLLHHFCGVTANKEYQNADWRLRPLPDEMLRYAREDTHYLLYMYDVMKIKLHSMSKESEHSDAPLVEVYKRSYDVCMQLYEKELLTENSYLYIYGLQGAGLNAEQLAIVAGLCEWRDVIARAEDESTGYILPNKTLLEIAKQMPVTAGKLRRLLKSKHPYVERNLGSLVSIIRHSMQNAAAFEAVAQHLKEGHVERASDETIEASDGSEVVPLETSTDVKIANARPESSCVGTALNGCMSVYLSASPHVNEKSLQLGSSVAELGTIGQGGSSVLPGANGKVKIESDCYTSVLPGESFTVSGQSSRDTSTSTGFSPSAKVSGATVQVLKKPSCGFGALLGNAAPKRKFSTDKKESEDIKLEQIRSSVNLPFHSFSGKDSLLKSVIEESTRVLEHPQLEGPSTSPASDSKLEDIITLENNGNSETTNPPREDKSVGSSLELDEGDEPMSLSDLSTSFQECFQSLNQTRKTGKADKSQEPSGFLQLKPFDYEAARKQVRLGEDTKEQSGAGSAENKKKLLDSGGRKKSSAVGQVQRGDETTEFSQGKRRQAFPASGNRSVTFR